MRAVTLADPADVAGWRAAARAAVRAGIPPEDMVWRVGAGGDLFGEATAAQAHDPSFTVPRQFVSLAEHALLHRDPARFALLYRILWRLRTTPLLLQDAGDADVHRAEALARAVRRDIHKMHAFVRFKEIAGADGPLFMAWFEPEHHIVAAAAPFFARRFTAMRWAILTPEVSVRWDGTALTFGTGARRDIVPEADRLDAHWQTYFRSIFNPARLKVAAMTKEMPKRYWRNLPEAGAIAPLIRAAQTRTAAMLATPPTAPAPMARIEAARRPSEEAQPNAGPGGLAAAAAACRRCSLYAHATQIVFGEGPTDAPLMLVGEQPGDQEDLAGRPFVGPAGQVLDRALAAAAIDRAGVYVTNAVKHFKYEPRGKRRLHKKPSSD